MIGTLACRMCGVSWQTNIHNLSEPVDIYSDWIDACESERLKAKTRTSQEPRQMLAASVPSVPSRGHAKTQAAPRAQAPKQRNTRREEQYEDETEDEEDQNE